MRIELAVTGRTRLEGGAGVAILLLSLLSLGLENKVLVGNIRFQILHCNDILLLLLY